MTAPGPCTSVQAVSRVQCSLEAGHIGVHIHYAPNGTTVWGWPA